MSTKLIDNIQFVPKSRASIAWMLEIFEDQIHRTGDIPRVLARDEARALQRILHSNIAAAIVATPTGYPDDFLGWAVAMNDALLFAYVRNDFRQQGIGAALAAQLTSSMPIRLAYWTKSAEQISHKIQMIYDIHAYRALRSFIGKPRILVHNERAA